MGTSLAQSDKGIESYEAVKQEVTRAVRTTVRTARAVERRAHQQPAMSSCSVQSRCFASRLRATACIHCASERTACAPPPVHG